MSSSITTDSPVPTGAIAGDAAVATRHRRERLLDPFDHVVGIDGTGDRHDRVAGAVVLVEEVAHVAGR